VSAPGLVATGGRGGAGATPSTLKAVIASPALHGKVTVRADGSFIYTPNPGYTGTDSFTYTLGDPSGTSSPAKVTLVVK
jgi:hypothetical protein